MCCFKYCFLASLQIANANGSPRERPWEDLLLVYVCVSVFLSLCVGCEFWQNLQTLDEYEVWLSIRFLLFLCFFAKSWPDSHYLSDIQFIITNKGVFPGPRAPHETLFANTLSILETWRMCDLSFKDIEALHGITQYWGRIDLLWPTRIPDIVKTGKGQSVVRCTRNYNLQWSNTDCP